MIRIRKCQIFTIFFILMHTGCTTINISGAQGSSKHRGILRLEPDKSSDLMVIEASGVGIVPGIRGYSLGYLKERTVLAYDTSRCQVLIFKFPENASDKEALINLAKKTPEICTISSEGKTNDNE